MLSDSHITGTGVYRNPDQERYEAWIVSQATGEKRCIGWLRDDGRGGDTEIMRRHCWEKEVWGRFLGMPPETG